MGTTQSSTTKISKKVYKDKAKDLSEKMGLSSLELLEKAILNDQCFGICINEGCNYTTEVETDQDKGYCESCQTNSVVSVTILNFLI